MTDKDKEITLSLRGLSEVMGDKALIYKEYVNTVWIFTVSCSKAYSGYSEDNDRDKRNLINVYYRMYRQCIDSEATHYYLPNYSHNRVSMYEGLILCTMLVSGSYKTVQGINCDIMDVLKHFHDKLSDTIFSMLKHGRIEDRING